MWSGHDSRGVQQPLTDVLYAQVAEFAGLKSTPNAALVDVCCGTGTIGITLARDAKAVR